MFLSRLLSHKRILRRTKPAPLNIEERENNLYKLIVNVNSTSQEITDGFTGNPWNLWSNSHLVQAIQINKIVTVSKELK